jgi:hypothetical protein
VVAAGDAYEMDREMQKHYQQSVPKDTKQVGQVKMRQIVLVFRYGTEQYYNRDTGRQLETLHSRDVSHKGTVAIAPTPTTTNHKVDTEETKMVCKIMKKGEGGKEDKSIGFFILKSRTISFVDARQAMVDQGLPINMDYRFCVPHLGPVAVKQESSLGPMLAFLESCTLSADLGDGSFANPVKLLLVGAPDL